MEAINNIDASKKKRPARRKHLHITTRAYLCKLVKERPVLWKRSHPLYKRNGARNAAWEEISNVMTLSVKDVKGYWASFREQYRYNSGKLKKGLSADSDEDQDPSGMQNEEESESIDQEELKQWDLWEHYKFIVEENVSQKSKSLFSQRAFIKHHQVEPMESASSESNAQGSDVYSALVDDSASSCGYNDVNSILDVTLGCDEDTERHNKSAATENRMNITKQANKTCAAHFKHTTNAQSMKEGITTDTTPDVGLAFAKAVNSFTSYMQRKQQMTVNGQYQQQQRHSSLFYALGFIETQLEKLSEQKRQELLEKFMQMCFDAIRQQTS